MIAKACRFYDYNGFKSGWHVAVYWSNNPEEYPHDYDLWLSAKEWRKLSGFRSPRKNETMVVSMRFEMVDEKKVGRV